jgi:hypothetical protein
MKHLFDYTYQTYVRNKKTPQQTGVFLKQWSGKWPTLETVFDNTQK